MYDIITDIYYTNFINAKNLSEASKANYEKTLRKLSNALNITLEENERSGDSGIGIKYQTVGLYIQETLPKSLPAQGLILGKAKSLKNQ